MLRADEVMVPWKQRVVLAATALLVLFTLVLVYNMPISLQNGNRIRIIPLVSMPGQMLHNGDDDDGTAAITPFEQSESRDLFSRSVHVNNTSSNPLDVDQMRRRAIRHAVRHAWRCYSSHAWGHDDLRPLSGKHKDWLHMGGTLVDSLDTLLTVGLVEEFNDALNWIHTSLSYHHISKPISVFECNIRILGGLLSAYELSGDRKLLELSTDIAAILLKAFDDPELPLPQATVIPKSGRATSPSWMGGAVVLAEIASLQMEFLTLSYHLNDTTWMEKPMGVYQFLRSSFQELNGLLPVYPRRSRSQLGQKLTRDVSFGALGDSAYEYLFKTLLLTGVNERFNERNWEWFERCINTAMNELLVTDGLVYFARIDSNGHRTNLMDHLTCFVPGLLALAAHRHPTNGTAQWIDVAEKMMDTCVEAYKVSNLHLGPEEVMISQSYMGVTVERALLRPEAVESLFVLWRVTKNPRYKEYGWEMFRAIQRHARLEATARKRKACGFSGIKDVTAEKAEADDYMQSFFVAETLKYLYLLHSEDSVFPLDEYVFNTEAHPFKRFDRSRNEAWWASAEEWL